MIDLEKREGREKEARVSLFCEMDLEFLYLIGVMVFFKHGMPLNSVARQKEDPDPTQSKSPGTH